MMWRWQRVRGWGFASKQRFSRVQCWTSYTDTTENRSFTFTHLIGNFSSSAIFERNLTADSVQNDKAWEFSWVLILLQFNHRCGTVLPRLWNSKIEYDWYLRAGHARFPAILKYHSLWLCPIRWTHMITVPHARGPGFLLTCFLRAHINLSRSYIGCPHHNQDSAEPSWFSDILWTPQQIAPPSPPCTAGREKTGATRSQSTGATRSHSTGREAQAEWHHLEWIYRLNGVCTAGSEEIWNGCVEKPTPKIFRCQGFWSFGRHFGAGKKIKERLPSPIEILKYHGLKCWYVAAVLGKQAISVP